MKTLTRRYSRCAASTCSILGLLCLFPLVAVAFPPAPPHTIFGTLRNEFGAALNRNDARVIFEADNGVIIETHVIAGLATGVNYEILVPMDAGIAPDLYRPNALRPQVPFRLRVIIGNQTYLPIEMTGSLRDLGKPAGNTRIDLTLGVDSDGDGLPDAWKDTVIAMLGGGLTRADIRPQDDIDGDGMSNFDEYIAGTYAWDSGDVLSLAILEVVGPRAVLEFLAIDGRTYTIEASSDLRTWQTVPFRLPAIDAPGIQRASFAATTLRTHRAETAHDPSKALIYRLAVR